MTSVSKDPVTSIGTHMQSQFISTININLVLSEWWYSLDSLEILVSSPYLMEMDLAAKRYFGIILYPQDFVPLRIAGPRSPSVNFILYCKPLSPRRFKIDTEQLFLYYGFRQAFITCLGAAGCVPAVTWGEAAARPRLGPQDGSWICSQGPSAGLRGLGSADVRTLPPPPGLAPSLYGQRDARHTSPHRYNVPLITAPRLQLPSLAVKY